MDKYKTQSIFLRAISHPTRLAILNILRNGEQCVCHIEAMLNLRQAYISQQLMTLKDAGLVKARRDGLNLYYRVAEPNTFDVLDAVSSATDTTGEFPVHTRKDVDCPCPKCKVYP